MPKDCCSKEEEARQQPKSRGEETPATASSASVPDNAERSSKPEAAEAAATVTETTAKGQQIKANSMASAASLVQAIRGLSLSRSPLNSPHLFWDTQPVVKAAEQKSLTTQDEGPIDATKTVEDVKKEPYNLPNGFVWSECSVEDPQVLDELYNLLALHYVEDDDNLFRFNYGKDFLVWALNPPNFFKEWIIGVRVEASQKLVGFISAIPTTLMCNSKRIRVAEVNFLCVHKKLRSKRLAPVLIKEITRRVNLKGIWQAVYTAGVVLPTPVAECRYWHRSLNPKKLVEVGFSGLGQRMTISRSIKLYKVREQPATPGLRPMRQSDVRQVRKLLMNYLQQFKLYPDFTIEEVQHWLMPKDGVVHVYVREQEGKVTDLISFYELPSSVIGNQKHKEVKAAYSFYNVATSVPLKELIQDALCLAKQKDFDVFNALDVMENKTFVEELKFGVGDGFLRYYLYNWRCPQVLHKDIGLVLL